MREYPNAHTHERAPYAPPQKPPELVRAIAFMHAAADALDGLCYALDGHECHRRRPGEACDWCCLAFEAERAAWLLAMHVGTFEGETRAHGAVAELRNVLDAAADRFCANLPPFGAALPDDPFTVAAGEA